MRERFGKLVLLHETEVTPLGSEYRAAKLGPAGLEKIVTILRLKTEISVQPEPARRLMDQAKGAAQLQNPNILKILGIGKVDQAYYISYEFVLGKSLQQMLDRCRVEQFPFAPDHALFIAAKTCAALEHSHGRRSDAGSRMFHGLLSPFCVSVSYDGDVKVKGFEFWQARLREAGAFDGRALAYLAPEQAADPGDTRSDIYSLGLILLEMLTGQQPIKDAAARLSSARLASPQGDDDSLPKPILEILQKALAPDPNNRYAEIAEMRKALDTLLFSGDFSPTTFNVAFFMHSLFRDDSDREQQAVAQEREANYAEFLTEEGKTPPRGTLASPVEAQHTPPPPVASRAPVLPGPSESHPPASRGHAQGPSESHPPAARAHVPGPSDSQSHAPVPAPVHREEALEPVGVSAHEAAAGFTFHKAEKKGKGGLIAAVALLLLLAGGGAAFYFLKMRPASAPQLTPVAPPSLSPEALATQQRIKDLESKLASLQAENEAASQKAADEAKQKVVAAATAKGQTVDPAALQKAADDARKKAEAEQKKKQEDDRRRIEEQKKLEEDQLAEQKRKEDDAAKAAEAARAEDERKRAEAAKAAATPTPVATPTPIQAGALVDVNEAGVNAPLLTEKNVPVYPPLAKAQRVQGVVQLLLLVNDKGAVTEVKLVKGVPGRWGLDEAAIDAAKKSKYKPATKDGVPVKVWLPVKFAFKL